MHIENVLRHCEKTDLTELTGASGRGAIVDTSQYLHFGGRARKLHRLVFMAQYTGFPDVKFVGGKNLEDVKPRP